jgi:hypothetical protein
MTLLEAEDADAVELATGWNYYLINPNPQNERYLSSFILYLIVIT